jgi:TPP-dependent 2-oxoacid decarboxylase
MATEIESLIKDSLDQKAVVFSDKSTSYFNIENYVEAHIAEKSTKQTTIVMLKLVHIAISNAKRNFLGVYHKINGEHLQKYLDEFVYKLNRRYFKSIFERLVVASVYSYWQTNE